MRIRNFIDKNNDITSKTIIKKKTKKKQKKKKKKLCRKRLGEGEDPNFLHVGFHSTLVDFF